MNDNILDSLEEKLEGKRYPDYIAAMCVFHSDKSPSMMVYQDTYKCLACGEFGSTQSLLKRLSNITTIHQPDEQEVDLPNPFYRWLKHNTLKDVLKHAWEVANNNPHMITYLTQERKIDEKVRHNIGIGWLDGFYTFPIRQLDNAIRGAFVRCPTGTSKRYFVPRGQDPNLIYAPRPNSIRNNGIIFLTFGGIDAISITQLGFCAISTTNGKRLDITALDSIRKRIIILPDDGEEEEARHIAYKLDWRGSVHELDYPDGTKDANGYYCTAPEQLKEELSQIVKECYK